MDITSAEFLSRVQFAFTVSFHIIFPAFTIGLAAWLAVLQTLATVTGRQVYDRLFAFWLKIFAVAFGLGVVSGIVMAFQFGTNWSELARRTGPIQGPLLGYESFTAFALEASFFGVLMFGRSRVPRLFYLFACFMVCLGTSLSAFWILVNNSWMQYPVGHVIGEDGIFRPNDWGQIIFNGVVWVRFPHMIFAAYITTSFCVASTGAWYMLRDIHREEARVMVRMGLGLACVIVPVQLFFGHLTGGYVIKHQPSKLTALEGHWETHQPSGEILIAWPDVENERNLFEIKLPAPTGSIIDDENLTGAVPGIKSIPKVDRPPMRIVFFAFRVMVGCGLLMLAAAWVGMLFYVTGRFERSRWLQYCIHFTFPLGFIAILTGWYTAEVGRQPWVAFGQFRTSDAVSPILTTPQVATSLAIFFCVYSLIFAAGIIYIYRMLKAGVMPAPDSELARTNPKRPFSVPGGSPGVQAPSATPAE